MDAFTIIAATVIANAVMYFILSGRLEAITKTMSKQAPPPPPVNNDNVETVFKQYSNIMLDAFKNNDKMAQAVLDKLAEVQADIKNIGKCVSSADKFTRDSAVAFAAYCKRINDNVLGLYEEVVQSDEENTDKPQNTEVTVQTTVHDNVALTMDA